MSIRKPSRETAPAQGSREAFEVLYRQHHSRVLGYALRRSSPDTAQDVTAETFLVAWRRWDSIPREPLPWLLAVARKTLANQHRATRRRQAFLMLNAPQLSSPPATDSTAPGSSGALVAALNQLPSANRELLQLIAWDGLTPGEAATVLGTSARVCRMRLHRAR